MLKTETVTCLYDGAVRGLHEVSFSSSKEEIDELNKALAVIDKWRKQALKEVPSASGADWIMIRYFVADKVIVEVEAGACG